jgi:hypothetical protein
MVDKSLSLALIYLKGIGERYKANESEKQATWNCKKSSVD